MSRATSLVAVAQQLSLSVSVALGASIVELTVAWRGADKITAADFQPAWIIVALISAMTALIFWRMPPDAGAEVSRRQTASSAGPTAASDQKQG
jgi:Na+(H+)/acetate symporter ActP